MGTGSFPRVKSGRGVTLTPHSLLVPWSRKCRTIPLLPLWAVAPVQSLSACPRVHFTLYLCPCLKSFQMYRSEFYMHFSLLLRTVQDQSLLNFETRMRSLTFGSSCMKVCKAEKFFSFLLYNLWRKYSSKYQVTLLASCIGFW